MSIYQRGDNWYLDFTFHGRRIRKMYGPSRKGADKAVAKIKAEIAENKFLDVRHDPKPVRFHDFAKKYLEWVRSNNKPSSYRNKLYSMRILDREFGDKNLSEITAWAVERWRKERKEQKTYKDAPMGPYEVNRELAALKHLFTKAVEWGIVKDNPAKKVKLLKGEAKRVRFLVEEEIERLLSNCGRARPIVETAIHTGMRRGEILGLAWDRVDLKLGVATLIDTKNNERRDVPLNKTVKAILEAMPSREGKVFDGRNLRKLFAEALKKSGIDDFRFHDLRHTFASQLTMSGKADLNTVRELLGHKTMAMTIRYSHLSPGHKARAVEVLDSLSSLNPPRKEVEKKVVSISDLNR